MKSASLILSTGLFAGISATTYDSWQPCTVENKVANSWNSVTARYSYRYKTSGNGPTTQKRCCPGHTGSECSPCAAGTFSAGFDESETGASLCLECPAGQFSVPGAAVCLAVEAANTGSDEASFQMKREPVNAQTGAPTPAHDWDTSVHEDHDDHGANQTVPDVASHGGEPMVGFSQTGGSADYNNSGVWTAGDGHHAHHAEIAGTNSMTGTGANSTGKYFKTGEHGVLGQEHDHASYDDQKATHENITDATQAPTKAPTIMVSGVHAKYCLNGKVFVMEGWVGACPDENYCRNCQCVRTWGAKSVVNVPGVTQGYLGVTTQTSTVNPVQNSQLGKHSDEDGAVYAPNEDGADYSRPLDNIKCGTAYKPQPTCKHITCSFVDHTANHTGRVVPKGTANDTDCTDPAGCGALHDAAARSTKTVKVTHHNHVNHACQLLDRFYAGDYTYPVGLSGERKKKEDDAACAQVDADLKDHRCGFNKFSGNCTCECTGEAEKLWQTYNHWHADNHAATHVQYNRSGDYTAIHKHAAPLTDFNLAGVSPDGFHQDAHGVTRDVHAHAESFNASKITEDTSGHDYERTRQDYHGTQSVRKCPSDHPYAYLGGVNCCSQYVNIEDVSCPGTTVTCPSGQSSNANDMCSPFHATVPTAAPTAYPTALPTKAPTAAPTGPCGAADPNSHGDGNWCKCDLGYSFMVGGKQWQRSEKYHANSVGDVTCVPTPAHVPHKCDNTTAGGANDDLHATGDGNWCNCDPGYSFMVGGKQWHRSETYHANSVGTVTCEPTPAHVPHICDLKTAGGNNDDPNAHGDGGWCTCNSGYSGNYHTSAIGVATCSAD